MWELPGSGGVDCVWRTARSKNARGVVTSRGRQDIQLPASHHREGDRAIFVHTHQGRRISPLLNLTIEFCEIYIPTIRALSKMPGPTFQSKPFIKSSAANANSFA